MSVPGQHPPPPVDLDGRRLPLRLVAGPVFRIYDLVNAPVYFGRAVRHRFDAPGKEFGVLYCGGDEHAAFVETFGRLPQGGVVTTTALATRGLARLGFEPPLRLVDLTGEGLARLGADARLLTGDYHTAQQWSLALWRHPEQPDGICYRSRHDPSRWCIAAYDRPAVAASATPLGSLLDPAHTTLLAQVLDTYGFALI